MNIGSQKLTPTLVGAALSCSLLAASVAAAQSVDPEADEVLRDMSSYLASLQEFSMEAESSHEGLLDSGQKLMSIKQIQAAVKRPDKLRIARQGMVLDQEMFSDGKYFTLFGKRLGLYATVPAGSIIETVIEFAHDNLNLELPGADLISNNVYGVLMSDEISGDYIGVTTVDGVPCHQLAYRSGETDWQIWVEAGDRPLPRKYVVTSRWIAGAPQYTLEIHKWILNPGLSDGTFEFTPPEGSAEIEFLSVIEPDAPEGN